MALLALVALAFAVVYSGPACDEVRARRRAWRDRPAMRALPPSEPTSVAIALRRWNTGRAARVRM